MVEPPCLELTVKPAQLRSEEGRGGEEVRSEVPGYDSYGNFTKNKFLITFDGESKKFGFWEFVHFRGKNFKTNLQTFKALSRLKRR